jgi:hypothetical protein
MSPTASIALVATLLLPAATAAAQDRYELRRSDIERQVWRFEKTFSMRLRDKQSNTYSDARSLRCGTMTIVSVGRDGLASSIRIAFDAASGDTDPEETRPFVLAGKTITVTLAGGELSHDWKGILRDDVMAELREFFAAEQGFLPDRPVPIGAVWRPTNPGVRRRLGVGPGDVGRITCRLAGFAKVAERRVAIVDTEAEVWATLPWFGIVAAVSLKGPVYIDLETGREIDGPLEGRAQVRAAIPLPSGSSDRWGRMNVAADGTAMFREALRPVPGGSER